MDNEGVVHVSDFGHAGIFQTGWDVFSTAVGSLLHLSPEQIKNADWEQKVQKSKFGKPYRLVNIRWNPNQNDKQESLF